MATNDSGTPFETNRIGEDFVKAPDGSQIRLLHELRGGGLSECTLPPSGVSAAVTHRTIEEIWVFTEGSGQVWREQEGCESVTDVSQGVSLTIPLGTHFQFRNTGEGPLKFVIATMPPWPGEDEAPRVPDYWPLPQTVHD